MKNRVLVLFAHPRFEESKSNKQLVNAIENLEQVTFHDLYEEYPDFHIDVEREQELLLNHDIIVWQHPLYWYSAPPLLKQWIDMVLEFRWAYGPDGFALEGKHVFNVITSGGPKEAYQNGHRNRFEINEFLTPFNQTAVLCNMIYLPPYWVPGTHMLADEELKTYANTYYKLLTMLINQRVCDVEINRCKTMNEWLLNELVH